MLLTKSKYNLTNIVRVIKSRRMRWAVHAARMGRTEMYTRFLWENLRGRDHLGDPGVDVRIILRWIFKMSDVGMDWIDLPQDRDRWRALVNGVMNLRVP